MCTYVALVIKDNIATGGQKVHDIVFAVADTVEDATTAIIEAQWLEPWWNEGRSVCRIMQLFSMDSEHAIRKTVRPPQKKVRVRMKVQSEVPPRRRVRKPK
jgi:hypothetical protein